MLCTILLGRLVEVLHPLGSFFLGECPLTLLSRLEICVLLMVRVSLLQQYGPSQLVALELSFDCLENFPSCSNFGLHLLHFLLHLLQFLVQYHSGYALSSCLDRIELTVVDSNFGPRRE